MIKNALSYVQGLEELQEGGERCFRCYALRLEETAALAKSWGVIGLPQPSPSAP